MPSRNQETIARAIGPTIRRIPRRGRTWSGFELSAQAFALLRQVRTVLDDEHGTNLADAALVATLCNAVLDGASQAEPTGRAKFQIAMTVCERCRQFFAVVDDHGRFAIQQGTNPSDDRDKIWSSTGNRLVIWPSISR